jgi:uncharacterized protein (TIGR02145 family)
MNAISLVYTTVLFFSVNCWAADRSGQANKTTKIGDQTWMTENLNVTRFRNGDPILEAKTTAEWVRAGAKQKPAWCHYQNDPEKGEMYGKLYNWYAVNDPRGLAPEGWHIPSTKEWTLLIDSLEGNKIAGMKMKAPTGWGSGGGGDNASPFMALPGGGRVYNGDFRDKDTAGVWWSATEKSDITAWGYNVVRDNGGIYQGYFNKTTGLSVRVMKN